MNTGLVSLLSILADGKFHSGETLASQLNISRAAIWKSVKQLGSLGLQIEAVRGKGYCLRQAIELLSEKKIKKHLSSQAMKSCRNIAILFKTDSTNSRLFEQSSKQDIDAHVLLAEYQAKGRGRRGNKWIAPLAGGLMFSVAWRFEIAPKTLGLLSLYMGVAIARALQSENIRNVGLKWPNDIMVGNKKIGGVLLEVRGEANSAVDVVIGIGLNYELTDKARLDIAQAVTDICSHTTRRLSRNELVAGVLSNMFEILEGLKLNQNLNLLDEWRKFDCYVEQHAKLLLPNEEVEGVLKGVDKQGALLMSVSGKVKSFTSGEVSLRVSV